jgi:CP family cyanate transporter-like MFS transporter
VKTRLALLWLAGISLRITILAVPPVIPRIHDDLGLNEKAIGALTALPVLLLAGAAVLGSLVVYYAGARRALIAGLAVVAAAGAARGLGPSAAVLYGMTFLMGCGVAICQPALPSLVQEWFRERVGLATATYSNGLLIGEVLAAGLMLPAVRLLGGSWELGLSIWSGFVVVTTLLVIAFTPHDRQEHVRAGAQWWPAWNRRQTWHLGLLLGLGQIAYWLPNAFIAEYLNSAGHPEYIAASLFSLNAGQLPASLLVAGFPRLLVQKRWPLIFDGLLIIAATVGFIATDPSLAVLWSGLLGFTGAFIFILNLALPPLLAAPNDVHRLSAGIFSISYSCAFLGPLLGGALWDATGLRFTPFLPVIVAAAIMSWLAVTVDLARVSEPSGIPLAPG